MYFSEIAKKRILLLPNCRSKLLFKEKSPKAADYTRWAFYGFYSLGFQPTLFGMGAVDLKWRIYVSER